MDPDSVAKLQQLMLTSLRTFQTLGKRRRRKELKLAYYNLGVASGIGKALTALGQSDRVTSVFETLRSQDATADEAFFVGLVAGHLWRDGR